MEDVLVRLAVVGAAVAVVGAAVGLQRLRAKAPRRLAGTGLEPGVYLFTSEACPDCGPAREKLLSTLGADRITEIRWEDQPEVFERLKIGEVPATLVVDSAGDGRLWRGQPDRMLVRLGP